MHYFSAFHSCLCNRPSGNLLKPYLNFQVFYFLLIQLHLFLSIPNELELLQQEEAHDQDQQRNVHLSSLVNQHPYPYFFYLHFFFVSTLVFFDQDYFMVSNHCHPMHQRRIYQRYQATIQLTFHQEAFHLGILAR